MKHYVLAIATAVAPFETHRRLGPSSDKRKGSVCTCLAHSKARKSNIPTEGDQAPMLERDLWIPDVEASAYHIGTALTVKTKVSGD